MKTMGKLENLLRVPDPNILRTVQGFFHHIRIASLTPRA